MISLICRNLKKKKKTNENTQEKLTDIKITVLTMSGYQKYRYLGGERHG